MTEDDVLFGSRLRLFTLAEELRNVSEACRAIGVSTGLDSLSMPDVANRDVIRLAADTPEPGSQSLSFSQISYRPLGRKKLGRSEDGDLPGGFEEMSIA